MLYCLVYLPSHRFSISTIVLLVFGCSGPRDKFTTVSSDFWGRICNRCQYQAVISFVVGSIPPGKLSVVILFTSPFHPLPIIPSLSLRLCGWITAYAHHLVPSCFPSHLICASHDRLRFRACRTQHGEQRMYEGSL